MRRIKVALVGNAGCGKSSLVRQTVLRHASRAVLFEDDDEQQQKKKQPMLVKLQSEYVPTQSFETHTIAIPSQRATAVVQDCGGRAISLSLVSSQSPDVLVLCVDLSDPTTVSDAWSRWLPEIVRPSRCPFVLACLKSDLADSSASSSFSKVSEEAMKNGAEAVVRCSAATGTGLMDVFDAAASAAIKLITRRDQTTLNGATPTPSSTTQQQSTSPSAANSGGIRFKVILIGEPACGKTALAKRFAYNQFPENYRSTIGVDFASAPESGLQIWDVAGQERFGSMTGIYYRDCHGAVFVFDVTRPSTFTALSQWVSDFRQKSAANDDIPKVLVANKCDLMSNVSAQDIAEFAQANGFRAWACCSAKSGQGVDALFTTLSGAMMAAHPNITPITPAATSSSTTASPSTQQTDETTTGEGDTAETPVLWCRSWRC